METGTCCCCLAGWLAGLGAYLQLLRPPPPPAPITATRETDHFDGQILRGALHAESKNIKERFAGVGCGGDGKEVVGGGGGREGWSGGRRKRREKKVAPVVGLLRACRIVSTGFLFASHSCRLSERDESGADEVTAKRRDPLPPGTRTMPARQG